MAAAGRPLGVSALAAMNSVPERRLLRLRLPCSFSCSNLRVFVFILIFYVLRFPHAALNPQLSHGRKKLMQTTEDVGSEFGGFDKRQVGAFRVLRR